MPGYLGIDLTGTAARPTDFAYLSADLGRAGAGLARTDADLLATVAHLRPSVVAIDAPLGFPTGWGGLDAPCTCGRCAAPESDRRRRSEVELRQRGIACYWTTRRSIIKGMIYRAVGLIPALRETGAEVIEVYPFAAKVRLWGRPLPKKSTPEGLAWYEARSRQLLPAIAALPGPFSHDAVDALLAAYTGYLHTLGRTEVLGLAEEGQIVLPLAAS